jgi:archaellum biogenesis protein FlaJ (TadC family)
LKISLLRSERSQIASGFTWLTIAMHTVLVVLVLFVYSVFMEFSALLQKVMPSGEALDSSVLGGMPSFGLFGQNASLLVQLHFMVIIITFILIFANSVSLYAVSGGHRRKILFYLALTGSISGVVLAIVPSIVAMLFGNM